MTIDLEIKNGYITCLKPSQLEDIKDGIYQAKISNMDVRSYRQNRALHKMFTMIADELNARNLSVTQVLKPDIMWSTETVKEQIWRPIQKALLNKNTTTKLSKDEVTQVYDVLNKALGERFGLHVSFPSYEE